MAIALTTQECIHLEQLLKGIDTYVFIKTEGGREDDTHLLSHK